MTTPNAPTAPFSPPVPAGSLGVSDAVAQAFRSAAQAFQVEAAALFRNGRMVAFSSPSAKLTMEQIAPAVAASTDVARRGSVTRFFTPPGSEIDYVLYATPVRSDLALVAFFTMDTPLGNARRSGQALVQAIVRAAAPEPQAESLEGAAPSLPRDWVPERASAELERTLLAGLGEPAATPARTPPRPAAVALPKDWVPTAPANEDRFPFLHPSALEPGTTSALPGTISQVSLAAGGPLLFSLVLVPRFPEHRLTGVLVERLRLWIHRLCLAWDWRAERIDIRTNRLAMVLRLGAEVAPAQAVQQLRDGLAARLLQTFPELRADLPSGLFWASPFLLTGGPLPAEGDINRFIEGTRRSQGFRPRR